MSAFLNQLAGGDRRSIGNAGLVTQQVLSNPAKLAEIVNGLSAADPLIRMRCADVAEKVSAIHPEWLWPHKKTLLELAASATQQEVRWHLAQMLPRLPLGPAERRAAVRTMFDYLNDTSKIVKVFAMQALAELVQDDPAHRGRLKEVLADTLQTGSPAMKARARKLLGRLIGSAREGQG
ncbi:hypothetical protein [Pelagibacterium limicola]|uniref:hypothetical protein n=1 Tax=Pelagibacterium limicola TaxID=2791022 RepID=UPI0018AFEE62|nr:hypothetical protein [Pelagibacterium limicola]